jgi:hypothetical protein
LRGSEENRLEKINSWLVLAANIGVLIGIAFLVVEINQNTQAQKSATIQSFVEFAAPNNTAIATSVELATIADTGDTKGLRQLTSIERRRYIHLATNVFNGWEGLYLQYLNGSIEYDHWASKRAGLAETFKSRGIREFWEQNAHLWYDRRFRDEIDRILKEYETEN